MPPHHARRLLPVTLLLLVVLGVFTPLRFLRWESWFGDKAQFFIAPISRPLAALSQWLAPARDPYGSDERIRTLEEELQELRSQLLRTMQESDQLRTQIRELQSGIELAGEGPIRQFHAPVYGSAGDLSRGLLGVRAGEQQGVRTDSVALAAGMQLLGRVVTVGPRTCTVAIITAASAGQLRGMVVIDNSVNGLICNLKPQGDGTLKGDVEDRRNPETAQPIEPEVGQSVRLNDPGRWPRSAQMLLVGRIEKVEADPEQPLRKVITVRPIITNLDRVSEVILRIPAEDPDAEGAP